MVFALGISGCMKEYCGDEHDPELTKRQPVLFQYEYYNYAWGFRHHGFLIDQYGNVNGFKEPKKWITPDSTGTLTSADLEYNIAQCDTICGKVDKRKLMEHFGKIGSIRYGNIKDDGLIMADAGTGVFSAWYWNGKAGNYENVFLISNGDLSRTNTHPYAKEVIEWLKRVGEKTNRFYWYGGQ